MTDDLVERVARSLCNTAGSNWYAENFNQTDDGSDPEDQREYYRMLARDAIALLRPAIRAEALEEAAKVADAAVSQQWQGRKIAAAIRALVKEPIDPGPASGFGS